MANLSVHVACMLCVTQAPTIQIMQFSQVARASDGCVGGPDSDALKRQNEGDERIVEHVKAAVVNIQATRVTGESSMLNDPSCRHLFGPMWGDVPREQKEHALGSGVLITHD